MLTTPKRTKAVSATLPTIAKIYSVMPEIQEDKDMLAIGARVIIKLDEMSDEAFQECHFNELYSE